MPPTLEAISEQSHHLGFGAHLGTVLLEQSVILEKLVEGHEAISVEIGHRKLLKQPLDRRRSGGEALA